MFKQKQQYNAAWPCRHGCTLVPARLFAQQRAISIATGGTGGVYYPLGGGLANILSKTIPGMQATARSDRWLGR